MKRMKRPLALIFSLTLLLSAISGCGDTQGTQESGTAQPSKQAESQATPAKTTLTIGLEADARSMDPLSVNDGLSIGLLSNIFEPLVRVNEKDEVVPALAESWEVSADGLVYDFKIKQGTKFHNGETVTAEDVVYSIKANVESVFSSTYMSSVDKAEVVDPGHVRVTLKYPYAPFLKLAAQYTGVIKESFYADGGDSMSRKPIGSGPFEFVE